VPFEPQEITDEQLEEYLKELQQNNAQWVPVDRAAAVDDMVVIDAEGEIGDEEVLSLKDHELTLQEDSNIPLPGFHAEIVGMSPGDEKAFALTYPDDDPRDELAGKEASFTVKLHAAKEQDLPPLDDDLAMMVGDYDSLDDLRAAIRENLETEALQQAETDYLDAVLEAVIEGAPQLEYPTQAIDREADFVMSQMERNLASTGLQLDNYLGMVGKTRDTYRRELRPSAEQQLQKRLVLRQVARLEGLEADPEEIEAEIDRLSDMLGEEAGQMRDILDTPGGRQSVAEDLVLAQVQERIKQIARGEAPPLEGAEAAVEAEPEAEVQAESEPELPAEEGEPEAAAPADVETESPTDEPGSEEGEEPAADTPAETEDPATDEQAEGSQPD
jgi:trigger factor